MANSAVEKTISTQELKEKLLDVLHNDFQTTPEDASDQQVYEALSKIVVGILKAKRRKFTVKTQSEGKKKVYYLSMEFLMGRSLKTSLYNLEMQKQATKVLKDMGISINGIYECEPDAGLGNGGLGRLAACYLDALAADGYHATGYSICYEYGIFKQKLEDGWQTELPDFWLPGGESWLLPRPELAKEVRFDGNIREWWDDNGFHHVVHDNANIVIAQPYDLMVAGKDGRGVSTLRLWRSTAPGMNMSLFNQGEYMRAMEQKAMAEVITQVLYPADNHREGKSLRLKQQYFFVSATMQSITRQHIQTYGTLKNFHEKNVIQINDTHPALVIPELMRILVDDAGLSWDEAWHITTCSVAYTNHTVLAEALECWPQQLFETLLPRVWQILQEIARRWQEKVESFYHDPEKTAKMAVIWDGVVRMANLCIAGGMAINGVSALHSDILRHDVFRDACRMEPEKFKNVTNGVDHRRWLSQINPGLDGLIRELIGDGYLTHAGHLQELDPYAEDGAVLARLEEIKRCNKETFARWAHRQQGVQLNTDAIFNVQVKRLHEYKRQLLNVLHIIALYQQLQDDPDMDFPPQTFLFGAKAAPGYAVAKRIIRLINSLADQVNNDPICKGKLQVVFLENYRVSMAEMLMPASEVSQQISTAGKEASGTGNMKFMMNGALTIGTLDGANVEMHEVLGDENMFLFGLTAEEASHMSRGYDPYLLYTRDPVLRRALDQLKAGFRDGVSYEDLYQRLLFGVDCPADQYLLLADFASYCAASQRVTDTYRDREKWNRMSLHNIARSGIFSADRSVADYADTIWHVPYKK